MLETSPLYAFPGREEIVRAIMRDDPAPFQGLDPRARDEFVCRLDTAFDSVQGRPSGLLTALHYAVLLDASQCVRVLLAEGANLEITDDGGRTPLLLACLCDRPELVSALLEHDADLLVEDARGRSALCIAAEHGFKQVLRALLAKKPPRDLIQKAMGYAIAGAKVGSAGPTCVRVLFDAGADPWVDPGALIATRSGTLAWLLEFGDPPATVLSAAADEAFKQEAWYRLRLLCEAEAKLPAGDRLIIATVMGDLGRLGDIPLDWNNLRIVTVALRARQFKLVRDMITPKQDQERVSDASATTLEVIANGDFFDRPTDRETIDFFLDAGLDPNLANENDETILFRILHAPYVPTSESNRAVRRLLERGADPNIANAEGKRALSGLFVSVASFHAVEWELLEILLGAGPNGTALNEALSVALASNNIQGALRLLEAGANPDTCGGWPGTIHMNLLQLDRPDLEERAFRFPFNAESRCDNGMNLLDAALYSFRTEAIERILDAYPRAHHEHDAAGMVVSIFRDDEEALRRILKSGTEVDTRLGVWTPLMFAAYFDRVAMIEVLLEAEADPNAYADESRSGPSGSVLAIAHAGGAVRARRLLLERGAGFADARDRAHAYRAAVRELRFDLLRELMPAKHPDDGEQDSRDVLFRSVGELGLLEVLQALVEADPGDGELNRRLGEALREANEYRRPTLSEYLQRTFPDLSAH